MVHALAFPNQLHENARPCLLKRASQQKQGAMTTSGIADSFEAMETSVAIVAPRSNCHRGLSE
jgi:hypothetical protein